MVPSAMSITADGRDICINIGFAGQGVVEVYTKDGEAFEVSPRGIGSDLAANAEVSARHMVAQHRAAFESLRICLKP